MKKRVTLVILSIATLFISGCAKKKINISAMQPALVKETLNYETLAVVPLENDDNGITNLLKEKLLEKELQGDKLNLVKIDEADALIFGSINNSAVKDSYFFKTRTICKGEKCERIVRVKVNCTKREFSTNVTLKMMDVETSKIIVSKTYSDKNVRRVCEDDNYTFGNSSEIISNMQKKIVERFVNLISPKEYLIEATIAEYEPDYDLTSDQEDMLEQANIAFENNDYQKAEILYKKVLNETHNKSYVATYNLALLEEKDGNFENALALYNRCVNLVSEASDVPELTQSRIRVEKLIKQSDIAKEQINSRN